MDIARTGKDKTSLRRMSFHSSYQVLRTFQITLPDKVCILGAKHRSKMDDVGYTIHRLSQRRGIKEITLHPPHASRRLLASTHERAAIHAGLHKPGPQPRTYQSGRTGY